MTSSYIIANGSRKNSTVEVENNSLQHKQIKREKSGTFKRLSKAISGIYIEHWTSRGFAVVFGAVVKPPEFF